MAQRRTTILKDLKNIMSDLGGLDRENITDEATFLELGFDSLFLGQISAAFKKKFGVSITFRQLFEEAPSPATLADYIDSQLPAEESPVPQAPAPIVKTNVTTPTPAISFSEPISEASQSCSPPLPSASLNAATNPASATALEHIISQQLKVMAGQLEVLKHCEGPRESKPIQPPLSSNGVNRAGESPTSEQELDGAESLPIIRSVNSQEQCQMTRVGPWRPIDKSENRNLAAEQRDHLDRLIERYTRRTQKSKELTAVHRVHLADPRAVAGFRREWKEMIYPIVSARSAGSKLWDIDGNQYIDMMMGFGPALFGHSPDFLIRALEDQLKSGIEIGPQSPIVGEVARMVCEFTGMERATFCNTGSEAVLAALRIARTVTGRSKIAVFAGSYHGIFDEVLVRPIPTGDEYKPATAAPGIPPHAVQDVVVLRYGDPDSLKIVEKYSEDLAAVLVEPVQSRRPYLQPKEFLHMLRELTAKTGIALIFDEVITGFRLGSGGAQAWFGVQADLATYGKALAGGLPIGAVAGKARFMDALDGGAWSYGDNSVPEIGVTYFAGTFVRHPLAIAAASAVLQHLKKAGTELYNSLNDKASRLAKELNRHFEETGAPVHIQQCGSLFCVTFTEEDRFSSLLFFYLREKGIHIWENRPTFISTAHTDEDLAFVARAMKESVEQMQHAGFFRRPEKQPKPSDSSDTGYSVSMSPSTSPYDFPLTEAQMEIWLATQLGEDASRAYNENVLLRFKGSLDIGAMRLAVQDTIARHDALRTTFSPDGEYQRVHPFTAIDIPLIDLSDIENAVKETRFKDLVARELQQPLDLAKGPLVRVSILRMEREEHYLLITAHHIVCDGWSIHVLLSDLSALYRPGGIATHDVSLLKPIPLREYAEWQQKQRETTEGQATERHWLNRFSTPLPALKLPTDQSRPLFRTFHGSCERAVIEKALHRGIKQLGASLGCTAFTTFLAAFKVLLHRLTGQQDLAVGIGIAGQSIAGMDGLVGHCVNMLPLRNWLDPNQSFSDFLKGVNRCFLDAYDHRNYTFGTLVRKLNLSRDPGQTPLISAMFNMDQELQGLSFANLEFELLPDPNPFVNFELSFNLFEKQGNLILECEYNTDLFDANTIKRWIGYYQNLLRAILAAVDQPIAGLNLLSDTERQRLLVEWNATKRNYPEDKCLHELFEGEAEKSPDAAAVSYEERQLNYRELNERANRLAHHLIGLGVGPDVLVGICMERSLEMVVALLAILKAGGAYVPLDPSYPQGRLAFMLKDSNAPLLLTQKHLLARLPQNGAQVLCLDADSKMLVEKSTENPSIKLSPENLAYVIYTSGSTGSPKGVMIPHKAIVNHMLWMKETFPLTSTDKVLQKTPISFDASVWEFYSPLIAGAQLILARPNGHQDIRYLTDLISERKVTVLQLVPSLLRCLLDDERISVCTSLRLVFCGGETLSRDLQQIFHAKVAANLINLYGPTEAAIDVTFSVSDPNLPRHAVPIGRPISNTQIYLLDSRRQPVPIGVAGELHIGGVSLARGYLNSPELTKEKFIANPFSARREDRLFVTGDLARHRADGSIEFLGRIDNQVKVRGFRIEPGEVEVLLNQHPAVRQALVTAREDVPGDQRLVAYIVPSDVSPRSTELRAHLKESLPEYMLPSAFVNLDTMPLTPSGKVDFRSLPKPAPEDRELEADHISPRTRVEETVAKTWREVLGVSWIGVHENFFDLGGHSLLAIRVIAQLNKAFDLELPLRNLFQFPTIAGLAAQIADGNTVKKLVDSRRPRQGSFLFEFQPESTGRPVFFFPGGLGGDSEFLVYARMAHHVGAKYAFYGLRARSADGTEVAHRNVEQMAAEYLEEMRSVQPQGPYFLVGNCIGGIVAYEVARQLEAAGEKIALLALMDTERPTMFDYLRYRVEGLTEAVSYWWGENYYAGRLRLHRKQMAHLGWRDIVPYLLATGGRTLRDISNVQPQLHLPETANDRRLRRLQKLQQSYEKVLRRYRPRPYNGWITLLINEEAYQRDPSLGWSNLVTGGMDIRKVQGDHHSYIRDHVQTVALQLKDTLESAEKELETVVHSQEWPSDHFFPAHNSRPETAVGDWGFRGSNAAPSNVFLGNRVSTPNGSPA